MTDEISSALIGLGGVVLGGGISAAMSLIIARAEKARFARERIWEVRREVYTTVIAKSAQIERALENHFYQFTDEAGGDTYEGSKAFQSMERSIAILETDLDHIFTENRIIISDGVAAWHNELCSFLGDLFDNRDRLEPYELAQEQHKHYQKETQRIMALAKSELGVSG